LAYSEIRSGTHGSNSSASVDVDKGYGVKIKDTAKKGDVLARIEGFVIFVPGTEAGDMVDNIRRNFASAHVV